MIYQTKRREFTSLDTIPGVAEFVLRRETVRQYETVLCYLHKTSGIEVFFKTQEAASMEILGSWYYTRGNRAASILSGEPSVPGEIPGGVARGSIPGRLAASTQGGVPFAPGKIPGSMTSCPTPVGQQAGVVSLVSFIYTRSARRFVYTRSDRHFVYTRRGGGVSPYSHQWPWGGERLGSRYTPIEGLRRSLRDWRREGRCLGDDTLCGRLVSPISNTVGSWARRSKAAASGRAASITTRVSGRAASGSSG